MIVEVRTYRIKEGLRERFLDLFRERSIPLQRSTGMKIVGPFIDLERSDTFVWIRAFPSLEARERMKTALYEGAEWTGELEAILMPMLDDYSIVLAEAPPWMVDDFARIGEEPR